MEGLTGGVLIGAEATYDTEATTKVAQLAATSTLGPRRAPRRTRGRLTSYASRTRQGPSYVDGEVNAGFSLSDSVIGGVLGLIGSDSGLANNYVIGSGAQDVASVSVAVNHGGQEYTYTGCVPSSFQIELTQEDAFYTLGLVGRSSIEEASVTSSSHPAESLLLIPANYGTLSIGGVDFDYNDVKVSGSIPTDMKGQNAVGASKIRGAFIAGPYEMSGTITLEFDDDATNDQDTVTLLQSLLTSGDGDLGTITLGSWLTLSNCQATGDWPSLQPGVQEFPLNFNTTTVTIVTS